MSMFSSVAGFNGLTDWSGVQEVFIGTITEGESARGAKCWVFEFCNLDGKKKDVKLWLNRDGVPYNNRFLSQVQAVYGSKSETMDKTLEKLQSESFKETCFAFFYDKPFLNREGKISAFPELYAIYKTKPNAEEVAEIIRKSNKLVDKIMAEIQPIKKEIKTPTLDNEDGLPF